MTFKIYASSNYFIFYCVLTMTGPFADRAVWSVLLQASSSKGPFSITVTLETQAVAITNVLFGDVWICSGQSNLVFTVRQVCYYWFIV